MLNKKLKKKRSFFQTISPVFNLLVFLVIASLALYYLASDKDDKPKLNPFTYLAWRNGDLLIYSSRKKVKATVFDERLRRSRGSPIQYTDKGARGWGISGKLFIITAFGNDFHHHVANAFLVNYLPFETDDVWLPMQTIADYLTYDKDENIFNGAREVWQTSEQTWMQTIGDCEDHAIAMVDWLSEMGYDARVVLGHYKRNGHAWVVLFDQGNTYLIEATRKNPKRAYPAAYPLAFSAPDYHPDFMFNKDFFWVNTGSKLTTVYDDRKWKKVSRFLEAEK